MDTWWIDEPRLLGSRNLTTADLEQLRGDGFNVLVSLLQEEEQAPSYNVKRAEALGFVRHNIPVEDFHPPTVDQLDQFVNLIDHLADGSKVVVHCQGGTGRTGTFAAAYWVAKGMTASGAIAKIRKARHDAVETSEQEAALEQFAATPSYMERESVRTLFEVYPGLGVDLRERLLDLFRRIRVLTVRIIEAVSTDMHQGTVALLGILNHTEHLVLGAIQQLAQGNGHVWAACARGLMETFGAAALMRADPLRITALTDHGIPAGRLKAAAEKASPGLKRDMDKLSRIVHPGDRAVYEGFRVTDEATHQVVFTLGPSRPPISEAQEGITVIANIGIMIADQIGLLLDRDPKVLNVGNCVMKKSE